MFQNLQGFAWIRVRVVHSVTVRVMGGVRVTFRVRVLVIPVSIYLYDLRFPVCNRTPNT